MFKKLFPETDSMEKLIRRFYLKKIIIVSVITLVLIIVFVIAAFKTSANTTSTANASPSLFSFNSLSSFGALIIAIVGIGGIGYPLLMMFTNQEYNTVLEAMKEYGITEDVVADEYLTCDKTNALGMSNHFLFITRQMRLKIIPLYNVIWVFTRESKNSNAKTVYSLVIRTLDKKEYTVNFYKTHHINDCLKDLLYQPHILIGYSDEYDKLYRKNFDEFLNIKYNSSADMLY